MSSTVAAQSYVKDKLGVELVSNKSDYLNKIIRAFFEKVPLQNISTSILPPEERFPTEENVIKNGNSLKGGLNVHNNWFFKLLLEKLDYKVNFVAASIKNPPSSKPRKLGSHFAILVKDLNELGDLYLVDVGSGYPLFKAVPLDQLPYTATDVTLTYRFVEDAGQWHSEHKDAESENWTRFATYDKAPVQGNPNEKFRNEVLEFLKEDWLVGGITAVHYPQPRSSAIPDIPDFNKDYDYVIRINNDKIIMKNTSGFKWEEPIPQDQMAPTFSIYFPTIPKEDVEKKLDILSKDAEQCRPTQPWYTQCAII